MSLFEQLEYPFPELPPPGRTVEIQPGVFWLRMPLPMALDHINVYLLEDRDGWWIVDTGIKGAKTRRLWEAVFADVLGSKPVIGLICTHMHPDHIGNAGWLSQLWKAPLWMTQTEYVMGRVLTAASDEGPTWEAVEFYRRVGMAQDFLDRISSSNPGFGSLVEPLPTSYRRVIEGDVLDIGGSLWEAVIGKGHSPEHLCLHCEARGLMLSGDQVIPRITSNISVMGIEPDANPLALWMESLERFGELPEKTLILPSHNTPFHGLHLRLCQLIEHHNDHLHAIEEACVEPRHAMDLLPVLFRRNIDGQMMLAMGECLAHLHLLMSQGRIAREVDAEGCFLFRSVDPEHIEPVDASRISMDDDLIMEYEGRPI